MKKNGDANNNPTLMFIISIIFIAGGIGAIVANLIGATETLFLIVGIVLLLAGCAIFVYAILRTRVLKAYKKLLEDEFALVTDATFIGSKLSGYTSKSVGVNGFNVPTRVNVYKKIIYEYTDEFGIKRTVKSTLSYVSKQIEYLQQKHTFKIKCRGPISAIIEEVPEIDSRYNL